MEENNFYKGEAPVNYERKCPVVFILDVSGSMEGERIKQLNEGLQAFQTQVSKDLVALSRIELSVVTFNHEVREIQEWSLLDAITMPKLSASGTTKMVDGVRKAMELIENRKAWYRNQGLAYYRPFIVLMTDGEPDSGQDVDGLQQEIAEGVDDKKYRFWAFGVDKANFELLNQISHPEFKAMKLENADFVKFFEWLSGSMCAIAGSKPGDTIDIKPDGQFLLSIE